MGEVGVKFRCICSVCSRLVFVKGVFSNLNTCTFEIMLL